MNVFYEALAPVLTMFFLVSIGFVLQKKGRITEEIGKFLSFAVVNITLPCSVYKTITESISFDRLNEIPLFVGMIMLSQVLSMLAAAVITKITRIEDEKCGAFIVATAFNNTLFMGIPVSVAMFGEDSAPIILYYYISSTVLFWTVGVRIIVGKRNCKRISFPSPMYGVIAGAVMLFVVRLYPSFALPSFMRETVTYLARMTTPLSMIFTGYALGEYGLKNIRLDKSIVLGLTARFIVSPMIFIALIVAVGGNPFYRDVYIVQAFMPVMASQTIIAREYGVDDTYPAAMVTISTLFSLIILPLVRLILTVL